MHRSTTIIVAMFCLCGLRAAPVSAQLILADDFSYADGPLAGANGGLGWSAAWNLSAGGSGTFDVQGGLALASLPSGSGSSFRSALRSTTAVGWASDGAELWFSARVMNHGAEGVSIAVLPGLGVASVGISNGFFQAGGVATAVSAADDVEYLLVGRLTRNDAGTDTLNVWVNPTSAGDAPIGSYSGFDFLPSGQTTINTFIISSTNTAGPAAFAQFDDLRAGSTFSDVVPVPEPGSIALCGLAVAAFMAWRRRGRLAR